MTYIWAYIENQTWKNQNLLSTVIRVKGGWVFQENLFVINPRSQDIFFFGALGGVGKHFREKKKWSDFIVDTRVVAKHHWRGRLQVS